MQKQSSDEVSGSDRGEIGLEVDAPGNAMALTVNLVRAYVANHTVPAAQLGALLEQTHRAVLGLATYRAEAVGSGAVETSIRNDCIMCLEDGKLFRSLKRHLAVHHGMTPTQYRTRWNLPPDYPMVAPDYAANRSKLAISMGFGGKGRPRRRAVSDQPVDRDED